MAAGIALSQRQNTGMVPEHLLGKSILKMSTVELQEYVRAQLAENPALSLQEERPCPICGCELSGDTCAQCGYRVPGDGEDTETYTDDWHEDGWKVTEVADEYAAEPFALVAAPKSLADHLKEQIRADFPSDDIEIADAIVGALDDDGYLREPLIELANRFRRSVPEIESVLTQVQNLDPPGIAARSLQECLLIQLRQLDSDSDDRRVAETVVRDHWDGIERMKLDKVAQRMSVSRERIESALRFIREELNPHPAAMFHDPWERLAPRQVSRTTPDVAVRKADTGLVAEIMEPVTGRVVVDETYTDLYSEVSQKKTAFSDSDRSHVRECVRSARCLIEALEFRNSSLARIADELVRRQAEFFTDGPSALKPMTKKELAQSLGVHESTVCRATQDKSIRLPSGEVMPIDTLFDSALPVKELVRSLATERLSDGDIADRLAESGIHIARRTVAKYRDQLRVLPVDYRLAA